MFGKIIILLLFGTSFISSILFIFSHIKEKDNGNPLNAKWGNILFFITSFGIIFISGYFLFNIISHNFQFTYIWSYSSRELPTFLLISSFYAGQEGSFLLWALFLAVIGFFFRKSFRGKSYQKIGMAIYMLIISFLLLMLIVKSPFNYVWETFKESNLQNGYTPENGRGLNPILENFWMVIHPPILFLGYSLMSIPYILALSGLLKRDYSAWIIPAIKWNLIASVFLGLGIMLGGFWAYESLGWGGFWGWDPVENSSFIPWLISTALVHTLIIQKRTGGLVKTNFILAIFAFVTVIYSTFLTRSGILSNFSVHSFGETGGFVYTLLLIFLISFLALGLILFFFRVKDLSLISHGFSYFSREFILFLGSVLILIITIIVFYGTSYPIISTIFSKPASFDADFYVQKNFPFAIGILIINAFSLYLNWSSNRFGGFFKRLSIPIVLSLIFSGILYNWGVQDFGNICLIFSAIFSFLINLEFLLKNILKKPALIGGYLSHIGLSFLLIGALASGAYSTIKVLQLHQGIEKSIMGFSFTFVQSEQIAQEQKNKEKYQYQIIVKKDKEINTAYPTIALSDFNQRQSPFLEPSIISYITKDLYISPKSVSEDINLPTIPFMKGDSAWVDKDSTIIFKFLKFDMTQAHTDAEADKNSVSLGAIFEIQSGRKNYTDTLITRIDMNDLTCNPIWKKIENSNKYAGFVQLIRSPESMAQSHILISVTDSDKPKLKRSETLTIEASIKPFMYFVWIGSCFIVIGLFIAIFNHKKDFVK